MWVVIVCVAEQEEEEHGIEVAVSHGGGVWRREWLEVVGEEVEGGEEVACNEEGLLMEGESVEVVEG